MPRKKRPPLSLAEQAKKLLESGIGGSPKVETKETCDSLSPLEDRIKDLLGLTESRKKRQDRMLFFVMYDIESNKVRRLVCKYLIREGCSRVQRSIFLADLPIDSYSRIKNDLAEIQALYDNEDSIIVLPVSTDYLRMMKVIGKTVDMDIITHTKNTLFF
jgi:CRISPR-associated protein Cas2